MSDPTPTASRIMVIRHAEKPADSPPPHGVDPDGDHDKESLTTLGWQRAGALACLFAPARGPLQSAELSTPACVYAADASKGDSLRPQQTVTPLADLLGLQLDTSFRKGDETDLVADATGRSGVVLIAWQHQDIPAIANAILGNDTTVPQKWPGSRFDLVWVFDLDTATGGYTFSQVPQLLLAGDSPDPITG